MLADVVIVAYGDTPPLQPESVVLDQCRSLLVDDAAPLFRKTYLSSSDVHNTL